MTRLNPIEMEAKNEQKLPIRDWFILPFIAILTIFILLASAESIARRTFVESETGVSDCMVNDPSTGPRGIPNSVCFEKSAETPNVEYKLNSCGHRAGIECGPKPAGTYRIVMLGSSIPFGEPIPIEKTLATRLPLELSRITQRKVELYNQAMLNEHPRVAALRFKDTLNAQPDMILWVLAPYDFVQVSFVSWVNSPPDFPVLAPQAGVLARIVSKVRTVVATGSLAGAANKIKQVLGHRLEADPVRMMILHYAYKSQTQALRTYLMESDDDAGFLKSDLSSVWKDRLQKFDLYAREMNSQAKAAGVPLVFILMPTRPQVSMISMGEWPAGFDPYKFDNELGRNITSLGGTYIDIFPDFRTVPSPDRLFVPMDGHPNEKGTLVFSRLIAKALTNGTVPSL